MNSEKDIKRIFGDKNAFRREVALAAVQIEGLGEGEISTALAYEVEPYSAIPAAAAEVAWREIEGDDPSVRIFDVAVVRRAEKKNAAGLARWLKPAMMLGVLILIAVGADYAYLEYRTSRLEQSLAAREPLQRELDRIAKKRDGFRRRAAEIRSGREAAVKAQDDCAALRRAYLDFFEVLSALDGKAVIKSISAGKDPFSLEFSLLAVDERSGSSAMSALTGDLADRGWELQIGDLGADVGAMVRFRGKARCVR
jgi:hypothetical protein